MTFDPISLSQRDTAKEIWCNENKHSPKKATRKLFGDVELGCHVTEWTRFSAATHLDGAGVVLRAAHHARGSVEAGGRLEGDGQVVGLRDVLHGGRVGV